MKRKSHYKMVVALQGPNDVAHEITYHLRKKGILTAVGKRRRAWSYALQVYDVVRCDDAEQLRLKMRQRKPYRLNELRCRRFPNLRCTCDA